MKHLALKLALGATLLLIIGVASTTANTELSAGPHIDGMTCATPPERPAKKEKVSKPEKKQKKAKKAKKTKKTKETDKKIKQSWQAAKRMWGQCTDRKARSETSRFFETISSHNNFKEISKKNNDSHSRFGCQASHTLHHSFFIHTSICTACHSAFSLELI